ncbi:hypothetical protein [Nocardia yamanashiensis]|nr:hypothetical protein [Nocardia yamanashiensis]
MAGGAVWLDPGELAEFLADLRRVILPGLADQPTRTVSATC